MEDSKVLNYKIINLRAVNSALTTRFGRKAFNRVYAQKG